MSNMKKQKGCSLEENSMKMADHYTSSGDYDQFVLKLFKEADKIYQSEILNLIRRPAAYRGTKTIGHRERFLRESGPDFQPAILDAIVRGCTTGEQS